MPSGIDFRHLGPSERLDLIAELWDSLDQRDVPLTGAQAAELDRRLASLEEDRKHALPADAVLAGLRRRLP